MNRVYRKCHRISFVNYFRNASTVSVKNDTVSQNFSENIKQFDDIPRMNRWEMILRFLPKGKYYGSGLNEMHRMINEEYGSVVKMPPLFGKPEMIFSYNDSDNETLLRNESSKPYRYSFEAMKYFREKIRPDIYGGEYGSIASENGEKWYKIRTLVNQIMLQPKMVQRYTKSINEITSDFINYILKRDINSQMSNRDLNLWSLESIAAITLDRRLGFFNNNKNEDLAAEKMGDSPD